MSWRVLRVEMSGRKGEEISNCVGENHPRVDEDPLPIASAKIKDLDICHLSPWYGGNNLRVNSVNKDSPALWQAEALLAINWLTSFRRQQELYSLCFSLCSIILILRFPTGPTPT